jgi:hypothetical protein
MKTELVKVGDVTLEVLRADNTAWIAVAPVCEALGIDARSQRRRLMDSAWATGAVMNRVATAADGKEREMSCLRYDRLAMWLATLETRRLGNGAARVRLDQLQKEAADVLDRWFRGTAPAPAFTGGDDPTSLLIANMEHNLKLARRFQQIEQNQQQLAAIQADQQIRVQAIEANQRAALTNIVPIVPTYPELPGISLRTKIGSKVSAYAAAMGLDFQAVWRLAYGKLKQHYHIDAYALERARGRQKLDCLEQDGQLEKLAKVCDTYLVAPAGGRIGHA